MKALIRHNSDPILETMNIPSINWDTGAPLTNPDWFGGPYQLVDNYVELADGAIYDVAVYPEPEDPVGPIPAVKVNPDAPVPVGDTIVIDGVTYTRTS